MKQTGHIWTAQPSGLLVPTGTYSDSSSKSKSALLGLKERAEAIEHVYADVKIRLPHDSGLGLLIQNAKEYWENWFLNRTSNLSSEMLFLALHLERIAEAILPLKNEKGQSQHLKDILSGTLNFLERKESHAKNMLWELEVWSKLRKKTSAVYLQEPPDIVVDFDGSHIGIACKKIYSEKHVQNVLSQAVCQIEKEFEFGIVAINIDDLLPADTILNENTRNAVSERLFQHNGEFIERHDRHFRKYLSKERLISAIISSAVISDIHSEKPRFNNSWQWTVWAFPDIPKKHQVQLNRFYDVVMN